jgi:hypothetical protein
MPSYGVSFRDPAALERVLGHVSKRPRRAKQLTLGPGIRHRHNGCVACGRSFPASSPRNCPDCGAFVCTGCDEITTANGGSEGFCLECLVTGREADPRVAIADAAE